MKISIYSGQAFSNTLLKQSLLLSQLFLEQNLANVNEHLRFAHGQLEQTQLGFLWLKNKKMGA